MSSIERLQISPSGCISPFNRTKKYFQPSRLTFKLGGRVYNRIGQIKVEIPATSHGVLNAYVNVVEVDIPLLIGLKNLEKHGLLLDYINDMKIQYATGTNSDQVQKRTYFLEWNYTNIFDTRAELT